MTDTNSRDRILWVDKAKGLAMILVIIGHVSGGLMKTINFQFVYGIHLPMFFLLTGYTFRKHELTSDYINTKFARLIKPYFYTCAAVLGMDILNKFVLEKDFSVQTVTSIIYQDLLRSFFASGTITNFGSISIGSRIGAIWFLPALFFSILIFELLLNLIGDIHKTGFISVGLALLGMITARFIWFPFSIQSSMLAVFFIWLGYVIRKQKYLEKLKWYHYVFAQCFFLFGIYRGVCSISFAQSYMADILLSVPTSLAGCLLIYLITEHGLKFDLLSRIGKNSLYVLCTHLFLLDTSKIYIYKLAEIVSSRDDLREWIYILFHIIFAVLLSEIIIAFQRKRTKRFCLLFPRGYTGTTEISKGILIVLLLFCSYSMDGKFQKLIYSILYTGLILLFSSARPEKESFFTGIKRLFRIYLIPYFSCAAAAFLLNVRYMNLEYFIVFLKKYLIGMSGSKMILKTLPSISPLSIVPVLFCSELIYLIITNILSKEWEKAFFSLLISLAGFSLGSRGFWLPWSFDIACYGVLCQYSGSLIKRYKKERFLSEKPIYYFILSPVWAYMIFLGSMNVYQREYAQFGWGIIGSLSGILLLCGFSAFIEKHLLFIAYMLNSLGGNAMIIIIFHVLFEERIRRFLDHSGFNQYDILNPLINILIQLCVGSLTAFLIHRLFEKRKSGEPVCG